MAHHVSLLVISIHVPVRNVPMTSIAVQTCAHMFNALDLPSVVSIAIRHRTVYMDCSVVAHT